MDNYARVAYYVGCLMHHTRWSHEQLVRHQNKSLREVVRYAYDNVPFYHRKLRSLGIRPGDVKTREDLRRLPVVGRDELQKNSGALISSRFDVSRLRAVSTSGSSGKPLFTYLTGRENDFRRAKLLRPHLVCGQRPRDRWVLIGPPHQQGNVNRLQKLLDFYVPMFVSVFDEPAQQIAKAEELKPDVLDGYSNSLLLIARELEKKGNSSIRPRFVMGGAELIDGPSRSLVEKVFQAPFYDQYASEELQMIAWQCPGALVIMLTQTRLSCSS